MDSPLSVVQKFIASINAADAAGISALMTEDHRFMDATGAVHAGREQMSKGWTQYLVMFPDYRIEIESAAVEGDVVAAFGWASGSFHGDPAKSWKFPAAFRGAVQGGRIAEWRVYADVEPMLQSAGMRRF